MDVPVVSSSTWLVRTGSIRRQKGRPAEAGRLDVSLAQRPAV
jgi:hypothetical protein